MGDPKELVAVERFLYADSPVCLAIALSSKTHWLSCGIDFTKRLLRRISHGAVPHQEATLDISNGVLLKNARRVWLWLTRPSVKQPTKLQVTQIMHRHHIFPQTPSTLKLVMSLD